MSNPVWTAAVNPPGYERSARAAPVVQDGVIYTIADRLAAAYREVDGAALWRAEQPDTLSIRAGVTLALRGGRLFGAAQDVVAMDAATGRLLWARRSVGQFQFASGVVDDVAMYIAALDHHAYAFDVRTGVTLWRTDLIPDCPQNCRPFGTALAGDTVYITGESWRYRVGGQSTLTLAALDRRTGRVLWTWESDRADPFSRSPRGRPLAAGRLLIVSDYGGAAVWAFDRFTRQVVWRTALTPTYFGPGDTPALRDGVLYAGDAYGRVWALDLATGAVRWQREVGGGLYTVLLCGADADGTPRLVTADPTAAVVSARDGGWRRRYRSPWPEEELITVIGTDGRRAYAQMTRHLMAMDC